MNQTLDRGGSRLTKPKPTWTRINRMDFRLGGISKALMLPTIGKRISTFDLEVKKIEIHDRRSVKRGKVGNEGENIDDISAGVENHPCWE